MNTNASNISDDKIDIVDFNEYNDTVEQNLFDKLKNRTYTINRDVNQANANYPKDINNQCETGMYY